MKNPDGVRARIRRLARSGSRRLGLGASAAGKGREELAFWRSVRDAEGELVGEHFEAFFTAHFQLDRSFYAGKRLLDIGCGPRGSLEWATAAAERVGLDPLVGAYRELGIDRHEMRYVEAGSEHIPFGDGHFDVVSSFNSLDHVDDLHATIAEIKRVLKAGGTCLLLTDVNHDPTPTEPIEFSWDVLDLFAPELDVTHVRRFEKTSPGVYQSVTAAVPYDEGNPTRRYGVLSARLTKVAAPSNSHPSG